MKRLIQKKLKNILEGKTFQDYRMKFFAKKGWGYQIIHKNENDHGGYRNVTVEISGPAVAKAMAGRFF